LAALVPSSAGRPRHHKEKPFVKPPPALRTGRVTIHSRSKGSAESHIELSKDGSRHPHCAFVRQLLPLPNCQRTSAWADPRGIKVPKHLQQPHHTLPTRVSVSLARSRGTCWSGAPARAQRR
jgi:hypothetical protein